MECPNCRMTLADDATFCAHCGWRVGGTALEKTTHNIAKVGQEAFRGGVQILHKTAKAVEPVVEKTTQTIEQGVEKARPAVKEAVDKTVDATKRAVKKGAEVSEKTARKVKEKLR